MAVDVKLPEMGEGIDSGTVVRILVKKGDSVTENQGLMELETDKALVEVPSDAAGTIAEILVKEGQKVTVGVSLVRLDGAGSASSNGQAADEKPAAKEGTKAEVPAKAEPQEASKEQAAAAGGQVELYKVEQGGDTEAGKSARPGELGSPQRQPAEQEGRQADPREAAQDSGIIPAGPATRRIARELNIELKQVRGSGTGGRITPEDVYAFARQKMQGGISSGGLNAEPELPDFTKWGSVKREEMSQVRRITAEHMARAWNIVPHVTQFEKIDITDTEELRKKYEADVEKAGGKLTLTVLIIKSIVSALKSYPQFNASLDSASSEIVYKNYYNIGIAVDTERGLLVPVLRDCDKMDIFELSVQLTALAERARSGKIDIEELRGGTFTISNQGGIGGAEFTPIVNWPEVAIIGIGRARKEPAYVGDVVKPRMLMPVGLSYDHRVIDGANAARFIRRLKESMETPERLLMGL
ncbi:MAG: 2-oxo acid dehydrogenase subunit E2 [bacterium]|nr:2-oxo acid dehydrogenase subunit E2 [bacterium]